MFIKNLDKNKMPYKKKLDKNKIPIKKKLLNRMRQIYIDENFRQFIKVKGEYVLIKNLKKQTGGQDEIIDDPIFMQMSNNDDPIFMQMSNNDYEISKYDPGAGSSYEYKLAENNKNKTGKKIFLKKARNNNFYNALNEVLASRIYREIYKFKNTLNMFIVVIEIENEKNYYIASELKENIDIDLNFVNISRIGIFQNDILHGFFVDCIMANWDLAERGNIAKINDRYMRMDLGGTMAYRAQGEKKNDYFEKSPSEHITYFVRNNPIYEIYKNLDSKMIDKSYEIIKNVNKENWKEFKDNFLNTLKKNLKNNLIYKNDDQLSYEQYIEHLLQIVMIRHDFYLQNYECIIASIKQQQQQLKKQQQLKNQNHWLWSIFYKKNEIKPT